MLLLSCTVGVDDFNVEMPRRNPKIYAIYPEVRHLLICLFVLYESYVIADTVIDVGIVVVRNCNVTELLTPIAFFMLEGRKDPSKVGMIYLCTFTLLKLSGERNFGVQLNKPFEVL